MSVNRENKFNSLKLSNLDARSLPEMPHSSLKNGPIIAANVNQTIIQIENKCKGYFVYLKID